jgi:hypothetical protein
MKWFRAPRRSERSRVEDPTLPRPLTGDRIRAWLTAQGYVWFVDSHGDIGGLWHSRVFYFFTLGDNHEILQVRGHWNRSFTIERLPELLEICNEWNLDRVWPKTYLRVRDDGSVHAVSESATDLAAGVADDQLGQLLGSGIASAGAFFDHLDARYPDPARQVP